MADEQLRLVATVQDQFSAPLRKLKTELNSVKKEGSGKAVAQDWSLVQANISKVGAEIRTGLQPAMAAAGIASLGLGAGIAAAAIQIKQFAGATRDLSMFGRQVGMSVDGLRELRNLGERFGQDWSTTQGALKTFSGNIDQIQKRWGAAYGQMLQMNLGDLVTKLVAAPNMEAAVNTAIDGLKTIQNPSKRRQVAELLFGTDQMAVVATEATEAVRAQIRSTLGKADPGVEEAARKFEENWSRMGEAVDNFKHKSLGPVLLEVNRLFEKLNNQETYSAIKSSWNEISTYVRQSYDEFLRIVELINKIQKWGNDKFSIQDLTPDDEIKKREGMIENLKGPLARTEDVLGRREARGDTAGATEARGRRDALLEQIRKLTEEIEKLRRGGEGGAQKMSFGGGGFGAGGMIHNASFGGGGGVPGFPGYGLGSAWAGAGSGSGAMIARGAGGGGAVGTGTNRGGGGGGGGSIPGVPDIGNMTDDERNKLGLILKYESKGQNVMNYMGRRQGLDPTTAKGYTAQGYYQMLNSNWRRLAPGLGIKTPNAMASDLADQTKVALALMRERPGTGIGHWANFNPALRAALGRGERAPNGVPNLDAANQNFPQVRNRRDLAEASGSNDTMWPIGWGRKEADGTKGDRMMGNAFGVGGISSGAVPSVNAEGKVNITLMGGLEKMPARVSAEGMFKDVEVTRGSQTAAR